MDPLKSESVPEINFEVSEDDNQGRKTTGSEGRAALALKAIRDKEEKAKRLIRERMEEEAVARVEAYLERRHGRKAVVQEDDLDDDDDFDDDLDSYDDEDEEDNSSEEEPQE